MRANPDEIKRREAAARAAIKKAFGTADDEFGATLFVSHHLEELESSYWKKHLSTETPEPRLVLDLLELRDHWGEDDELERFDSRSQKKLPITHGPLYKFAPPMRVHLARNTEVNASQPSFPRGLRKRAPFFRPSVRERLLPCRSR
jgi:hypothetical protein